VDRGSRRGGGADGGGVYINLDIIAFQSSLWACKTRSVREVDCVHRVLFWPLLLVIMYNSSLLYGGIACYRTSSYDRYSYCMIRLNCCSMPLPKL